MVVRWTVNTTQEITVYRGRVNAPGQPYLSYAPGITIDVTGWTWIKPDGNRVFEGQPVDLNGDGVSDYVRLLNSDCNYTATDSHACQWQYGFTDLTTGQIIAQQGYVDVAPGTPWEAGPYALSNGPYVYDYTSGYYAIDMDGDGLADSAWLTGHWYYYPEHYQPSYNTVNGDWDVRLNTGATSGSLPFANPSNPSWGSAAGYNDPPNHAITLQCENNKSVTYTVDDLRYGSSDLLDFNGDGRPDLCDGSYITWNNGQGFGSQTPISQGGKWAQYAQYNLDDYSFTHWYLASD